MSNAVKNQTSSRTRKATATPRRPRAERERLHFRIEADIKQRAEEAAMILGQDLSTFAESALDEKAQAVIARAEKLVLSERDFARFVEAIENPAPPNARLREAAEKFKNTRRRNPELNW